MRVLNGYVLVAIKTETTDSLVRTQETRKGTVEISGTSQLKEGEQILFGEAFEEIELETRYQVRYLLMKEDNVKIVLGEDPNPPSANILPFLKRTV